MKIYDFVLLGEELAGVWLLKKLCEIRKNLSSGKRPGKKFPKHFLWIRTNVRSQNSYTLPAFIADSFEIELSKTWHLDLVFPNKNFAWNRDRVDSFLLNNPIFYSCKGPNILKILRVNAVFKQLFQFT